MEPPAVTSCGVGHSSTGGIIGGQQHSQSQKRDNMSVGFLQIEPQISFNAPNRHFEELPENFLETISPQQHGVHGHPSMMSNTMNIGSNNHDVVVHTTTPQLASLTTVSMADGSANGNSAYTSLVPMPSSSHYISTLKMESMEHLGHHSQLHQSSQMEKTTFGNGPAGLLSPLQLESNRTEANSIGILGVHHHRPNGGSRTSDLLSGIRRNNVSYIKEEINPSEIGYQSAHDYDGNYSMQHPTAQELERMANAETPPALSNVEITSSILASLSRQSPSPNIQHQESSPQTHFIVHQISRQQPQQQQQLHNIHQTQSSGLRSSNSRKSKQNHQEAQRLASQTPINIDTYSMGTGTTTSSYNQLTDMNDPLNAEIDDEIYIDTKDLCKRVAYELKQHSIPQAIFAERILCRSQGTLSDLLRNPKPWNRLKSGRETFKRMYNWLQQPLHIRLSILDMYKGPMASAVIPPPTPAQNSRHHHRRRTTSTGDDGQAQKRPRLVFTDIQKRTLQAIFKETQRPSREMQQTIAEHLRLDMSTVSNFFMNARRRSRNGNGLGDEPAPYQQSGDSEEYTSSHSNEMAFYEEVRTITPPPDSPPTAQQQQMLNEPHQPQRRTKSASLSQQQSSAANLSHIEQTVDEVVGRSIAYARKSQYAPPVSQTVIEQPPIWEEEVQTDEIPFASEESGIGDNNVQEENLEEEDEKDRTDSTSVINNSIGKNEMEDKLIDKNDEPTQQETVKFKEGKEKSLQATDDQQEQTVQNPKAESPLNDAEAPTAPGTPNNDEKSEDESDQQMGIEHKEENHANEGKKASSESN